MSAVEEPGLEHRLVARLAGTPGAVHVLVALRDSGEGTTEDVVRRACSDVSQVDGALGWLTDVGLIQRSFAVETGGGESPVVYELTEVGAALMRSLTDLARALAEPAATGLDIDRLISPR